MFAPPSVQKEYALVFSGDPALVLPEDEKERLSALRVARETGVWDPLLKAGEEPTLFWVRPITGTALTWLLAEQRRERMSEDELYEMSFRLALRRVDNFGKVRVTHESYDGQQLASRELVNEIYRVGESLGRPELGRALVIELGNLVLARALEGPPPK